MGGGDRSWVGQKGVVVGSAWWVRLRREEGQEIYRRDGKNMSERGREK